MTRVILSIRDRLDRVGVLLSGLCALHCLLGLLLVSVLGLGGQMLLAPEIHEIGLALAVLVGAVTLGLGVMRHGQTGPLLIGTGGIVLMASALVVGHGPGEAALTIAGVALVAIAHIRNLRHAA
ncbi:MAG: MerC domain-containing protein [Novosphingobium sp.]